MTAVAIPTIDLGPKLLEEMTYTEVSDALTRTDVAIITPSAVEQHGSHLPLGTDWYIGIETTRRVIARLAERGHQIVGYAFPLGKSEGFINFPCSLTLSNDTFVRVQQEIIGCLHHQGFKRFILLSGNGGNGIAMQIAGQEIFMDLDCPVMFIDALPFQFSYRDEVLKNPKIEHHGAEGETSKILVVHPELVQLDKAGFVEANAAAVKRTSFGQGVKRFHDRWEDFAPKGVVGDPTLAEKKTGEIMYDRNSEWIAGIIEQEYFA